eukprot:m51a1_g7391 putative peptidyl-prolyl cis-trans isomerase fkbp53-like (513) ;mRNA; r:133271-135768
MFWGLQLKPNEAVTEEPETTLHITQAALGACDAETSERNVLQCQIDGKVIVLCSLRHGAAENVSLDLVFAQGSKVTFFASGPGDVYLSGYHVVALDDYDDDDDYEDDDECACHAAGFDEEDLEDDDDDDDDDEAPRRPHSMLRALLESGDMDEDDDEDFVPEEGEDEEEAEGVAELRRVLREEKAAAKDKTLRIARVEEQEGEEQPEPDAEEGDRMIVESATKDAQKKQQQAEQRKRKTSVHFAEEGAQKEAQQAKGDNQPPQKRARKSPSPDQQQQQGEEQAKSSKQEKPKAKTSKDAQQQKQQEDQAAMPPPQKALSKKERRKAMKEAQQAAAQEQPQQQQQAAEKPKEAEAAAQAPAANVPSTPTKEADPHALKRKDTPRPTRKAVATEADSGLPIPMKPVRLKSGLVVQDVVMGKGNKPTPGKTVAVRYIGRLVNGKVFDENLRGQPFRFRFATGEVIRGWDVGISGMRVGGKRRLTIPPALAYGSSGAPPDIPPQATLSFEVELISA